MDSSAPAVLPPSARRVAEALAASGVEAAIRLFCDLSTRTAEEAARAVGCNVAQIVKSLVFVAGDQPILVLVSGAHRADPAKLASLAGAPVRRAGASEARDATGYAVGGIPPVGLARPMRTFMDETLLRHPVVWAAAGTPHAVFPIGPLELLRITRAVSADLCEGPPRGSDGAPEPSPSP